MARPRGILPTVPVHDLKIHPRERELIAGTHGRGIWIADISEIEELTPTVRAADAHLFEIDPVIDWEAGQRGQPAAINFAGVSRPTDMGISYFLKNEVSGDVKIRVYSGSRVIAEMDGAKTAGVNVVRWNLQGRRERIAGEAPPAAPVADAAAAMVVAAARRPQQRRLASRRLKPHRVPIASCCQLADASTRSSRRSFQTREVRSGRSEHED